MGIPDDWKDILIHCGAAAAMTAIGGLAGNVAAGAVGAMFLFYGREQAQQALKADPLSGFESYLPWKWGPHGKREFICVLPVVAVVTAAFAFLIQA